MELVHCTKSYSSIDPSFKEGAKSLALYIHPSELLRISYYGGRAAIDIRGMDRNLFEGYYAPKPPPVYRFSGVKKKYDAKNREGMNLGRLPGYR